MKIQYIETKALFLLPSVIIYFNQKCIQIAWLYGSVVIFTGKQSDNNYNKQER